MEEEILLGDLFALIKKNILMIIGIVIFCVILSWFATSYLIKPIYSASTQVLVNQTEESNKQVNVGEVQSNIQLVNTYRVIIKSPRILKKVQKENIAYSVEQLNDAIEVNSEANSQVINVTVKDTNLADAVKVANDTAEIFEDEIGKIMKIENVSILSKADEGMNKDPVSPNLVLNLAIAAVLGILISIFIIFLRKSLDKTISTEKELEDLYGINVLGSVRKISKKELKTI